MTAIPFICIGVGLAIGFFHLSSKMMKFVDGVVNAALVLLMITIGLRIGTNEDVMGKLPEIGIKCAALSLLAIAFSVFFTVLAERTILPLSSLMNKINQEKIPLSDESIKKEPEERKGSPLILIMPSSIIGGVLFGAFLFPDTYVYLLSPMLTISLIVLYTGVGMSMGANRGVFQYIKILGAKVLFLSIAIAAGSFLAGICGAFLLNLPLSTAVTATGGMSYYSITGAYMTEAYGIEAGTYGFIVNVMREFLTVLLLPLLVKISKGSPIASGAAGNMDTMLVPVTKFVGPELGLVALVTGVILTFAVPFVLPLLGLAF